MSSVKFSFIILCNFKAILYTICISVPLKSFLAINANKYRDSSSSKEKSSLLFSTIGVGGVGEVESCCSFLSLLKLSVFLIESLIDLAIV